MVKKTKKTNVILSKLNWIRFFLGYYMSDNKAFAEIEKDFDEIEKYIIEVSADKKVDHARFASKFKSLFFKENKELKEEILELKEEIETIKTEENND
jgi:hypothetical protein